MRHGQGDFRRAVDMADKYGFSWRNHDWHCVSITYGKGEKQLGIWGHLDVVPLGEAWIYPYTICKLIREGWPEERKIQSSTDHWSHEK